MNEKQYLVESARRGVANAESQVREARLNLERSFKTEAAKVAQAVANQEYEYSRLKEELRRCENNLEAEKAYLRSKESALEKGFDA